MTTAAEAVPATSVAAPHRPSSAGPSSAGTVTVWRLEAAKLCRQLPVLGIVALSIVAPFLLVAGLNVQSTTPMDTLFGRWVHESGFAVPLVVLGFAGQWALPVLISVVAGDMFAAEDHFGTWKTLLTRSVTRGQIFAGKILATVSYALIATVILALASVVAGLTMGTQPLVGLSGQLVPSGHALVLVFASWASVLPAVVVFSSMGLLFSVATRSRPASLGAPVVIAWALQLFSLVNLPTWVADTFPTASFGAWHGFWAAPSFAGPFVKALVVSCVWTALLLGASAIVFFRRGIPTR